MWEDLRHISETPVNPSAIRGDKNCNAHTILMNNNTCDAVDVPSDGQVIASATMPSQMQCPTCRTTKLPSNCISERTSIEGDHPRPSGFITHTIRAEIVEMVPSAVHVGKSHIMAAGTCDNNPLAPHVLDSVSMAIDVDFIVLQCKINYLIQ